ncbi:MAG: UDP-N-acetylmuramate dehydrogenase [Candidatus Doudnabacteria bacterium]|nr:UDP-N-acetylmuramate dehydrogenase [Candidatus Doudnabacteria bacterium]
MQIEKNKELALFTTMRVGGPARFFVSVKNLEEAREALSFAAENKLGVFVLGGGSNILVSDKGFDGLVIKNEILGLSITQEGVLEGGAGEAWDLAVQKSVEGRFAGIETLSGIPSSLGGAIVQNIGAYGQTVGDVVESVTAIDMRAFEIKTLSAKDCGFGYRTSFLKQNPGKYLLTSVKFALKPGGLPTVTYPDIIKFFQSNKQAPTLALVRDAVLSVRARKGHLIMPGFESYNSAGSYFKNPVVEQKKFDKIKEELQKCKPPWFWDVGDKVKVAAAALIESAGFSKGYALGKVGISSRQALTVVNLGGAKASDIRAFTSNIRQAVKEKFGLNLEEEIIYVGNFNN